MLHHSLPTGRAAVLLLASFWALFGQSLADQLNQPAILAPDLNLASETAAVQPAGSGVVSPESYVLGPGDGLSIHVLQAESAFSEVLSIAADGSLRLPLAGSIQAGGLTTAEFEAVLSQRLKTYFREPHIAVNVAEYRRRPVTVLGAVARPGTYNIAGEASLLEMISQAGGLRPDAGHVVQLTRKAPSGPLPVPNARLDRSRGFSFAEINLSDALSGTNPALNVRVLPQDVISIPRGEMIYVVGAVHRASGFVLEQRQSLSVLEVLSLAGGLAPKAAPERAKILRPGEEGAGERIEVAVNLKSILNGEEPDLRLGSEDVLFVPFSGAKVAAAKAVDAAITIGTGLLIWRR